MARRNSSNSNWTANSEKLWIDVPPTRYVQGIDKSGKKEKEMQQPQQQVSHPVRATVTTLLRQHQAIKKHEKEEKVKVDGFLQGNSSFDFDGWKKRRDIQAQMDISTEDAKRRLKAKLAYHKAIEASRQVVNQKFEHAHNIRNEARRLREEQEMDKEVEMERRRALAAEIHEESSQKKRLIEQVQLEKRQKAKQFKEQAIKLQQEARTRDLQEFINRKEKIQQIQASRLALKAATSQNSSLGAFIGALGSPDTEIRLQLSKEAQQAELEEKRRKVLAANEERKKKLSQVKQRLDGHVAHSVAKRQMEVKFQNLPSFKSKDHEDVELAGLLKELEKFKLDRNSSVRKQRKTF